MQSFNNNFKIYHCFNLPLSLMLKIDADESRSGLKIYVSDILLKMSQTVTLTCRHRSKDWTILKQQFPIFRRHSIAFDIINFLKNITPFTRRNLGM